MLWSAPAPVQSSSVGAPGAVSVWPEAAVGSAAPGSGWTDSQQGPAGQRVGVLPRQEAGRELAGETELPQTRERTSHEEESHQFWRINRFCRTEGAPRMFSEPRVYCF